LPLSAWLDRDVPVVVDVGPRLGGYFFVHEFTGDVRPAGVARQTYLTFAPGVHADVGWMLSRFAHVEVGGHAQYLPYTVDELRHLLVLEGFASVWLDL
jgi:hypothetical protein